MLITDQYIIHFVIFKLFVLHVAVFIIAVVDFCTPVRTPVTIS